MAKRKWPWDFTKVECGVMVMVGTVVAAIPWVSGYRQPYAIYQTLFGLAVIAFGIYMMPRI